MIALLLAPLFLGSVALPVEPHRSSAVIPNSQTRPEPLLCPILLGDLGLPTGIFEDAERDFASIVGAVREERGDDTARLVLSDKIAESTEDTNKVLQARSEFLRVQVELSQLLRDRPLHALSRVEREKADTLVQHENDLLKKYGSRWIPSMPGIKEVYFRRGLADEVVLDLKALFKDKDPKNAIESLFGVMRDVTRVKIEYSDPASLRLFLSAPQFSQIRELDLSSMNWWTPEAIEALAQATTNLESLNLASSGLRQTDFETLLNHGNFGRLHSLNLIISVLRVSFA